MTRKPRPVVWILVAVVSASCRPGPGEEAARREACGRSGSAVAPGTEAVSRRAKGSFTIRLLPEIAPQARGALREDGEGRRLRRHDLPPHHQGGIIQGGDPLTKDPAKASQYGTGGLGLLKAELSDRPFVRGTVAAVRRPSSLDSAGHAVLRVPRRRSRRSRASTRSSAR